MWSSRGLIWGSARMKSANKLCRSYILGYKNRKICKRKVTREEGFPDFVWVPKSKKLTSVAHTYIGYLTYCPISEGELIKLSKANSKRRTILLIVALFTENTGTRYFYSWQIRVAYHFLSLYKHLETHTLCFSKCMSSSYQSSRVDWASRPPDLKPEFNQSSRLHGVGLKTMMVAYKPPGRINEHALINIVSLSTEININKFEMWQYSVPFGNEVVSLTLHG